MKRVILTVTIWLAIINAFAVLAANRLNLKDDTAYAWINPTLVEQEQTLDLVRLHSRWDSFWLLSVADTGYRYEKGAETDSNIVFFPIFPALVRFVTGITGGDFLLGGWLVSIIFLFLSAGMFYKLVQSFHPNVDPMHAIFFFLIFPTAFFLNAVYTESTYLFFSIATFFFLFQKRFWLAGLFAFFASLTRITGLVLFLPLLWEYVRYLRGGQRFSFQSLAVLFPIAGTGIFFLYHALRFGDGLLFFKVQNAWGRAFEINVGHFLLFSPPATANLILDTCIVVASLVGILVAIRRGWHSYALYMFAVLATALATGTMMSINRYALLLFPLPILLASVRSTEAKFGWALISTLLLTLYTTLFVNWYWAG